MDWLVRGETRRARAAARRVVERLRGGDGDSNSNGSSDDGGPSSGDISRAASVAQLLEDRVDVVSGDAISPDGREEKAQAKIAHKQRSTPSLVPEFDAGAFGGFAGFGGAPAPAPAPARFGFGMDLKRDSLDARLEQNSAVEDATSISVSRVGGRFRNADEKDASARFSASEAEEAASLVASRGAARSLPGLTGAERVGLLATLDALRDADGGADAAVDEAGRRFRALRRARALRDARSRSLDGDTSDGSTANRLLDQHGPRGEELAWATQSDAQHALLASFGLSSDGSRVADGPDPDSKDTSWRALRMTGAPLWVRDDETLRKLTDAAARDAFAKTRDPGGENPCALLFAALGRANTLAGVFRAARDTRLADFFSRDFSLRKNREAALKNAYALLSKHRYLFASAFFVLAGAPQDAAALVWKHAGDLSLAVAVARLAKDASLDGEISREVSSREIRAESRDGARDEKKLGGHSSNDDGTLSASAFAGFGDFADHGASPLDGRVARLSPDRTPGAIKITEEDANEEAPREKKEKKEEAPLPASLSPAAKAFLKARVVPDFEARFAASRGKNVEDAWTLAALRWLCGDGDASVETLRRLVRDESASSEDKASAADLCAFVSRRRALLETAPALARDAADAAADATGALALALEAEGMPLAALERRARFPNENERPDADDGSEKFRGFAERNAELNAFPFGAIAASAATRARADVIARLTATALAPETLPGTFPEASFRALAKLLAPAKNAFDESAEAAARASLARRDASLAFSVASAEKKETRRGPEEREARRLSEFLEPADLFAATEKALDSALDGEDSALDPDAKESSRRLPSVDLDPESAKRFFSRDARRRRGRVSRKKKRGRGRERDTATGEEGVRPEEAAGPAFCEDPGRRVPPFARRRRRRRRRVSRRVWFFFAAGHAGEPDEPRGDAAASLGFRRAHARLRGLRSGGDARARRAALRRGGRRRTRRIETERTTRRARWVPRAASVARRRRRFSARARPERVCSREVSPHARRDRAAAGRRLLRRVREPRCAAPARAGVRQKRAGHRRPARARRAGLCSSAGRARRRRRRRRAPRGVGVLDARASMG
jgi:hypothetical protein